MFVRAVDRFANLLPLRPLRTSVAGVVTLVWCACAAAQPCESFWYQPQGTSPVGGTVNALTLWDPDGDGPREQVLVVGGDGLATYDLATHQWTSLNVTGTVRALAVLPSGELVAGGNIASAGSVSNAANIVRWNGTAWSTLGGGLSNTARVVLVGSDGALYVGGDFVLAGGQAASRIARWDGSFWSPLGAGVLGSVHSLAFSPDGRLLAGGMFTSAGSVQAKGVAAWDGSQWSAFGSGFSSSNTIRALLVRSDGRILAAGTAAGSTANLFELNGTVWSRVPTLGGAFAGATAMLVSLPDGLLTIGGTVTNTNLAGALVAWDGQRWGSIGPTVFGTVNGVLRLPGGDLAVGGSFQQPGENTPSHVAFVHLADVLEPRLNLSAPHPRLCPGASTRISAIADHAPSFSFAWSGAFADGSEWWSVSGAPVSTPLCSGISVTTSGSQSDLDIAVPITARFATPACPNIQLRCRVSSPCGVATSTPISVSMCTADFNCDFTVSVSDLFDYLNVWFNQRGSSVPASVLPNANYNAAPAVTIDDLYLFLGSWAAPDPTCVD